MDHLIDRYVYDVVSRLPEKERAEVRRELTANIYDMLPEDPDRQAIEAVLYELGSPALLAQKYRQSPGYLISPAFYDSYVRVVKHVVPLVGVLLLVLGMVLGAVQAIRSGPVEPSAFASDILRSGLNLGFSGALQSLLWITVGFAVGDRNRHKRGGERQWSLDDLPDTIPQAEDTISLAECIVEAVGVSLLTVLGILVCLGAFPLAISLSNHQIQILDFLSPAFLRSALPLIVVMGIVGMAASLSKLVARRWTVMVAAAVITSKIINLGIMLYLINRPDLLSAEFSAFLQGVDWSKFAFLSRLFGDQGARPPLAILTAILVLCTLFECGEAVYKAAKGWRRRSGAV